MAVASLLWALFMFEIGSGWQICPCEGPFCNKRMPCITPPHAVHHTTTCHASHHHAAMLRTMIERRLSKKEYTLVPIIKALVRKRQVCARGVDFVGRLLGRAVGVRSGIYRVAKTSSVIR